MNVRKGCIQMVLTPKYAQSPSPLAPLRLVHVLTFFKGLATHLDKYYIYICGKKDSADVRRHSQMVIECLLVFSFYTVDVSKNRVQ